MDLLEKLMVHNDILMETILCWFQLGFYSLFQHFIH